MTTILYGCGNFYRATKKTILQRFSIDYICDQKLDEYESDVYDGISIIKTQDAYKKKFIQVIICVYDTTVINDIMNRFIEKDTITFKYFNGMITGRGLLEKFPEGQYEDILGNRVLYDETISPLFEIHMIGTNNEIVLGRNIKISNKLQIYMGCEGRVSIGDETTFVSGELNCSWGKIQIGCDCMFSWNVFVRNDDGHHIFYVDTGERLNYCGDVVIGDHCWIGQDSMLLKGINVADGCVIGARSVVTKSVDANSIVAGNPAKVVKTGICWKRNWTKLENIKNIYD